MYTHNTTTYNTIISGQLNIVLIKNPFVCMSIDRILNGLFAYIITCTHVSFGTAFLLLLLLLFGAYKETMMKCHSV